MVDLQFTFDEATNDMKKLMRTGSEDQIQRIFKQGIVREIASI
jgi:acyl-CoA-binding protein